MDRALLVWMVVATRGCDHWIRSSLLWLSPLSDCSVRALCGEFTTNGGRGQVTTGPVPSQHSHAMCMLSKVSLGLRSAEPLAP